SKTKNDLLNVLSFSKSTTPHTALLFDVVKNYKNYLKDKNIYEEKEALQKMCSITIEHLQKEFDHPIVLGGTTGSIPFIQDFSKILHASSKGYVVLPGFFKGEEDIDIYHPFYTQKIWDEELNNPPIVPFVDSSPKNDFLSIFKNQKPHLKPVDHIIPFDANTPLEEAKLISILVRDSLEKNLTVSIVCNDKSLIHLIQDALNAYDFKANNALGIDLLKTVSGKFLTLFLKSCLKQTLKNIIPLLKHPLFKAKERSLHLKSVDRFEAILQTESMDVEKQCLKTFNLSSYFEKYLKTYHTGLHWLNYLIQDLEDLSDSTIFKNQDGTVLFGFLESLKPYFSKTSFSFFQFIDVLMAYIEQAPSVLMFDNLHQNVTLVGTIEARHQTADVVIISALNEGQWPKPIKQNLWLSPFEKEALHLPKEERRLGLGAHDFLNCLQAKTVYLTRSLKVGGIPLQENRWLKRFKLNFCLSKAAKEQQDYFLNITKQLMAPLKPSNTQILEKTYPKGFDAPKELSISALELLNKDPYAFYVRYILKIKERLPWYLSLSPAKIGQIVHKILEKSNLLDDEHLKEDIEKELLNLSLDDHQMIFLTNQLYEMILFVINDLKKNPIHTFLREQKISLTLEDITIFGIADRIDFDQNNTVLRLIDYKTGTPPSFKNIENGLSLQMPLLYQMSDNTYCLSDRVNFDYIALKGYKNQSKIINLPITKDLADKTLKYVETLLQYYFKSQNSFKPL
ncbi:MAG: PD-(D/E)XK nuclease family protein, partial [Proteobacteria bacterium]|nr:PD-(D/E)XK nuclease family protein [Pseudomonadota bacterium]